MLKEVQSLTWQLISREMGMVGTVREGDKIYHLFTALQFLMEDVGHDYIREMYGDKYNKLMEDLRDLEKKINKVKMFHDALDEGKIRKGDPELMKNPIYHGYCRAMRKLPPLTYSFIYSVYLKLAKNSTVWHRAIPTDVWKKVERKYQKIEYKPEKESKLRPEGEEATPETLRA